MKMHSVLYPREPRLLMQTADMTAHKGRYYILKISCFKKLFLEIFGYRIGYKYPLIYILPMSESVSASLEKIIL
jgi:hypothetical protein